MDVVFATSLYPQRQAGDEPEPLEVVAWPVEHLDRIFETAAISDARTLAALFVARRFLRCASQRVLEELTGG